MKVLKRYALQLISLLPNILKGDEDVEKKPKDLINSKLKKMLEMPYGLRLEWELPGGMPFILHLKDNHKVQYLLVCVYRFQFFMSQCSSCFTDQKGKYTGPYLP